jgi:hypothetical protein
MRPPLPRRLRQKLDFRQILPAFSTKEPQQSWPKVKEPRDCGWSFAGWAQRED